MNWIDFGLMLLFSIFGAAMLLAVLLLFAQLNAIIDKIIKVSKTVGKAKDGK